MSKMPSVRSLALLANFKYIHLLTFKCQVFCQKSLYFLFLFYLTGFLVRFVPLISDLFIKYPSTHPLSAVRFSLRHCNSLLIFTLQARQYAGMSAELHSRSLFSRNHNTPLQWYSIIENASSQKFRVRC